MSAASNIAHSERSEPTLKERSELSTNHTRVRKLESQTSKIAFRHPGMILVNTFWF